MTTRLALLNRVWNLHSVNYGRNRATGKFEKFCDSCKRAWPCPTISAIGERPMAPKKSEDAA